MGYKKYFCSFADSRLWRSLERIKVQAEEMNVYDQIFVYDENNLNLEFREHFKDKLVSSRGFGYWVWKPQVILQILEKMDEGDILQYTDAGCHLNRSGVERLNEYFEMANLSETGILAFQSKAPDDKNLGKPLTLIEKHWTKGDLFDYFGVRSNKEIVESEQCGSGIIFIKKSRRSTNIISDWMRVYYDDFSLIDDTLSKSPNIDGFVENRHDQSAFSIIAKINNIPTVSSFEYWQLDFNFSKLKQYPIWAIRDKDAGGSVMRKIRRKLKRNAIARYLYYTIKRWKHYFIPYELEKIANSATERSVK